MMGFGDAAICGVAATAFIGEGVGFIKLYLSQKNCNTGPHLFKTSHGLHSVCTQEVMPRRWCNRLATDPIHLQVST